MPSTTVALVLAPASSAEFLALPPGSVAWVAVTPAMQATLATARSCGLVVTELFPNGASPSQWLYNHLDSLDQHHNEFSQIPAYTDLVVYGVEYTRSLIQFLSTFGFVSAAPTEFGFSASKVGHEDARQPRSNEA